MGRPSASYRVPALLAAALAAASLLPAGGFLGLALVLGRSAVASVMDAVSAGKPYGTSLLVAGAALLCFGLALLHGAATAALAWTVRAARPREPHQG